MEASITKTEENLDGKYLLRSADRHMTAEDIAAGYKQLLLVRVAENQAGQSWPTMRRELQRISVGTFIGLAGTFRQRTDVPKTDRDMLTALKIDVPRKIHQLGTPES
jgi:hypothetical protein